MQQKMTQNKNLLLSVVSEMSPSNRAFTSNTQLVCNVLPFLIHIIQPTLRPVSPASLPCLIPPPPAHAQNKVTNISLPLLWLCDR